jgi:DNA polymerase-3 subunit delta'
LLLVGGQYSGKAQLALAMSRLLLCSQGEGGNNCGRCHACKLSASGSHGDFKWVQPQEKSRVIKIDQVRDLVQFTQKTAAFGMRKVIVIAPADSMNVSAFNALLKSLEEPAEGTYLILVCNRLHGVPATIRSRCQILRLVMPDAEASLSWLDAVTGNRKESQKLLTLAADRPLLAKQLYESADTEAYAQRSLAIQALLQGHISVSQAGAMWDDAEVSVFLEQCSGELQYLLRSLSRERLRTREVRAAFGLLDEIVRLQQAVSAGVNPSRQLLVESLLSKVRRELGGTPLGDNIQPQLGDVRV